jgi:hypothetical protein
VTKRPYAEVIQLNLFGDPNWGPYARGERGVPDHQQRGAGPVACFLFYRGDLKRAQEVSLIYSVFREQEAAKLHEYAALWDLFEAAAYRDLAQKHLQARRLWETLVVKRRDLNDGEIVRRRKANYWIYEAYALTKLERYDEVVVFARKGFEEICKGHGIEKVPHRNSLEYGLVAVLEALAAYKLNPTPEGKKVAQRALLAYKKENARYGRLGYNVIFDLQFSYPHVFTSVLPGPDPEKD